MPRLPGAETVQRTAVARPSPQRVPNLSTVARTDLGEGAIAFAERLTAAEERVKDREAAIDTQRADEELHRFSADQYDAYDKTQDFARKGAPEEFGAAIDAKMADIVDRYKQTHGKERALEAQAYLERRKNAWADKAARRVIELNDDQITRTQGSFLNSLSSRVRDGENPIDMLREGVRWLDGDETSPGIKNMFRPDQERNFRDLLGKRVWGARFDRLVRTEQFDEAERLIEDPMVQGFMDEGQQRDIWDRILLAKKERAKREAEPVKKGEIARQDYEKLTEEEKKTFHGIIKEKKEEKLVAIYDEKSPTGTRMVRESEAEGKAGPPRERTIERIGEGAFAQGLAQRDIKTIESVEKDTEQASVVKPEIARMKAALASGRFKTGAFADTRQFVARVAEFAGIDTTSGEVGKWVGDAATADTLDAASNRIGIAMAEKLSRFTNLSLTFIRDSLPNLMRTPEGNSILMEVMDRQVDRAQKIESIKEDYVNNYKTLRPEGKRSFYQVVRDLDETDPIINDKLRERIIQGSQTAPKSWKDMFGFMRKEAPDLRLPLRLTDDWVFDHFDETGYAFWRNVKRPELNQQRSIDPVIDPKTGEIKPEWRLKKPTEEPAP